MLIVEVSGTSSSPRVTQIEDRLAPTLARPQIDLLSPGSNPPRVPREKATI